MRQDSSEITVALSGNVWVASLAGGPVSLPTNLDPPAAPFVELGYTTEDGVTFTNTPNIEDLRAWQKATPVRRLVTGRDATIAFTLMQMNLDTFALAFGGGTWTEPSPGLYRYDPPGDSDDLAEYAVIVDFADGDRRGRVVLERATINEAVETQLVRNNSANLPITLASLTPDGKDTGWYFLSDDDAFAPGS